MTVENNIQWNPVNMATIGPYKFDRINGVAVLTRDDQISWLSLFSKVNITGF